MHMSTAPTGALHFQALLPSVPGAPAEMSLSPPPRHSSAVCHGSGPWIPFFLLQAPDTHLLVSSPRVTHGAPGMTPWKPLTCVNACLSLQQTPPSFCVPGQKKAVPQRCLQMTIMIVTLCLQGLPHRPFPTGHFTSSSFQALEGPAGLPSRG